MTRENAHGKARPEAAPSSPLLLQLTPAVAGHAAVAIRTHREWAARVGLPLPPELSEVERLLAESATSRHEPPDLDGLAKLRDRPVAAPRLLDYRSVASVLSVGTRTVERLVAAGALRTVQVGGACRVPVAALDAYLNELEKAA